MDFQLEFHFLAELGVRVNLIEIAFDFEQVSKARIIPNFKLNDEYL